MKEEDKPFMTVSLKVDAKTKMGIVTEVKQALRQAYALKINYSATQRSNSFINMKKGCLLGGGLFCCIMGWRE